MQGLIIENISILGNHLAELWDTVKGLKGGRIDFVLDNAGFELYCDCVYGVFSSRPRHDG